ncbi:MAG TPA: kelch repeat-containing protein [Gemmatimonadales bacterium]|nr:kelch repeat-containing protein [Gemmatimonadales bacterium]
MQSYNPSSNVWSLRAPLPAARHSGNGAATITGTIYLAGGKDAAGALTRTLYAYNSSTNSWTLKAPMPAVGGCGGSAPVGGRLYVFSGCTRSSTGAELPARLLHRYDPSTNSWATLKSAPVVHVQPAVVTTGGKLYVIGGRNSAGAAFRRVDIYDPATNAWTTGAAMPTARIGAAGGTIAGRLYVAGGQSGTTYLKTVDSYDPASNSWSSRRSMPAARAGFGAGVVENMFYVVGGRYHDMLLKAMERYTP